MYTLVEPKIELIKELEKENIIPIVLFKIRLNNKESSKTQLDKIKQLKEKINPNYTAIQVTLEKTENYVQGFIDNLKNQFDIVIGLGGLNKVNRFFLEQTKIDFLQDPHNSFFKSKIDFIHHFNSGLNQVLCQMAKEKNIGLFNSLNFTTNNKYIHKEIGRINQNIKFTNKWKIPLYINFIVSEKSQIKNEKEIKTISTIFDMNTSQRNSIVKTLEDKINTNKNRKSKEYISDEIKLIK